MLAGSDSPVPAVLDKTSGLSVMESWSWIVIPPLLSIDSQTQSVHLVPLEGSVGKGPASGGAGDPVAPASYRAPRWNGIRGSDTGNARCHSVLRKIAGRNRVDQEGAHRLMAQVPAATGTPAKRIRKPAADIVSSA